MRYAVSAVILAVTCLFIAYAMQGKQAAFYARMSPLGVESRPQRHILFVGNSYTFYHDMPFMIPWIAATAEGEKSRYTVEMIVVGGRKLIEHAGDQPVLDRVHAKGNDYVVLQEQSLAPLYINEQGDSLRAIQYFSSLAKQVGAEPVIYGTWARKTGNEIYASQIHANFLPPSTPQDMLQRLDRHFDMAAQQSGAGYLPVGKYWEYIALHHPELNLFEPDGSHPNVQGSYLVALLFYRYVSGNSPEHVTWTPAGVIEENGKLLRKIAAR